MNDKNIVPKINFTDMDCLPKFEEGFIYVAIMFDWAIDSKTYETLLYKGGDFLVWDGVTSTYEFKSDDQDIISVAKLSKYGSNEF